MQKSILFLFCLAFAGSTMADDSLQPEAEALAQQFVGQLKPQLKQAMTEGGPGSQTDTTTTFMYKLAFRFQDIGQAAAMSVVNFTVILLFILLYLRIVDWRKA